MTRVDEMTKQTLNCSLKNDYLQMVKITRWTDRLRYPSNARFFIFLRKESFKSKDTASYINMAKISPRIFSNNETRLDSR